MNEQAVAAEVDVSETMEPVGSPEPARRPRAVTPLAELRNRHRRVKDRRDALQEKLTAAQAKEADLVAAIDAMKSDIANGDADGSELPDLARNLDVQKTVMTVLAEALAKVDSDEAALGAKVHEIETEIERRRQEKESAPPRAEHARLIRSWIAGVAALHEPLRQALALRAEFSGKFPLVGPPSAPAFTGLVRDLSAALPYPDGGQDLAVNIWLRTLLKGPLGSFQSGPGAIGPEDLRALGIEDK